MLGASLRKDDVSADGPAASQRPPSASIRVALVEDQRDIREGLALLIGGTEGYRCTGSYWSMEDALPAIASHPPDIVLIDLGLPGMSGIDGIRRLKEAHRTSCCSCSPSTTMTSASSRPSAPGPRLPP
jgi:DNA-binding NarL/FixJ family response regulator